MAFHKARKEAIEEATEEQFLSNLSIDSTADDGIQMIDIKVGRNLLVNQFQSLNNKINFSWFNDSFELS